MDKEDLIVEAGNLSNAISGLESFQHDQLSAVNSVTVTNLSALAGLIAAISALAEKHEKSMQEYLILDDIKAGEKD